MHHIIYLKKHTPMFVYSNCLFNMSRLGFIFGLKLFSLFIMYEILYNVYVYIEHDV